jgi:hypothetical protein
MRFGRDRKDRTKAPRCGDPGCGLKMEAMVAPAKPGPAAVPLPREVAKGGSSRSAVTTRAMDAAA